MDCVVCTYLPIALIIGPTAFPFLRFRFLLLLPHFASSSLSFFPLNSVEIMTGTETWGAWVPSAPPVTFVPEWIHIC
jgi:hypothetical protein